MRVAVLLAVLAVTPAASAQYGADRQIEQLGRDAVKQAVDTYKALKNESAAAFAVFCVYAEGEVVHVSNTDGKTYAICEMSEYVSMAASYRIGTGKLVSVAIIVPAVVAGSAHNEARRRFGRLACKLGSTHVYNRPHKGRYSWPEMLVGTFGDGSKIQILMTRSNVESCGVKL